MSEEPLWLVDKCASLRCNTLHNRNVARTLAKDVQRSLLVESRKQAESSAKEIGACLDPESGTSQYLQEFYTILKRLYQHASVRATNPSRSNMENVTG